MSRTELIHFRVSKKEKEVIQHVVESRRLTVSDYCRYVALKQAGHDVKIHRKKPHLNADQLLQLRTQLNKIAGSPLHQMIKWVNKNRQLPHHKYLVKISEDLEIIKRCVVRELS